MQSINKIKYLIKRKSQKSSNSNDCDKSPTEQLPCRRKIGIVLTKKESEELSRKLKNDMMKSHMKDLRF